jgi:ubiquinone/menaquinone biosynthesis C-methylase UbiE
VIDWSLKMTGNNPDRVNIEDSVAAHYGRADLGSKILDALAKSGADPEAPTLDELAPVDEFHTAGRIATIKALNMMPLSSGMHVLDAGCGIGGTSRYLAGERRCHVTGIDLTPEYVDVARMLTGRVGLSGQCEFVQGSVLDLPFEDARFDAAVTFHVAMNIQDRARFYAELARVMKPDASLCVFDVMQGSAPGMLYPVPWAETVATSFLKSADETKALLSDAGFTVTAEENLKSFALQFFEEAFAKIAAAGGPPPVGVHLLTGQNSPDKFSNYFKGLQADHIEPVIMIAKRA